MPRWRQTRWSKKNMNEQKSGCGFFLFLGGMTVVAAGLKLFGLVDFGWLWVFSPIWVPVALVVAIGLAALVTVMWKGGDK